MKEEYGKRCQLCGKYKRSRMFYRKLNRKYLRLCEDCWERNDLKNSS